MNSKKSTPKLHYPNYIITSGIVKMFLTSLKIFVSTWLKSLFVPEKTLNVEGVQKYLISAFLSLTNSILLLINYFILMQKTQLLTNQRVISATISVIIMAFNEAGSLEDVVREMDSTLTEMGNPYKILIVDDGSSDGTEAIAERLAEQLAEVRVIHHKTNQGLGAVYRTGFAQAQGDFVTFFPADGQFPATIITQFRPLMNNADMVLGYVPNRQSSLLAKLLSTMERVLYRLLFGSLPEFQGILMFRRNLLHDLELKSTGRGWAVLMELIIRASRGSYTLISVPTEMRSRMSGVSKVKNISTIWANLRQMILLIRYL